MFGVGTGMFGGHVVASVESSAVFGAGVDEGAGNPGKAESSAVFGAGAGAPGKCCAAALGGNADVASGAWGAPEGDCETAPGGKGSSLKRTAMALRSWERTPLGRGTFYRQTGRAGLETKPKDRRGCPECARPTIWAATPTAKVSAKTT